jgi:hypothetical protein
MFCKGDIGMAKGISIHIGLNRVDPNHYQDEYGNPWDGALSGCEGDAADMQALAEKQGFSTQVLLNEEATAERVSGAISKAAKELKKGDILFLTYSGHGGQVPDRNGPEDEEDEMDETWCLYDRQLIDDELYALWGKFEAGVRILMLSDSCHSGTVAKDPNFGKLAPTGGPALRLTPKSVQDGTYEKFGWLYDKIQEEHPAGEQTDIAANVILISGCQDNQFSSDGDKNGLFTGTLLRVWNKGKFRGSVVRFWRRIVEQMPLYQSPNLFKVGVADRKFERQRPFTV